MRKYISLFLLFVCINYLSLSAADDCSSGRYIDQIFNDYTVINKVIYGRMQTSSGVYKDYGYDVYLPKGDTATSRALVILEHGSAFLELPILNIKSPDIVEFAIDLVKKGYVVMSVEYRLEKNPLSFFSEEKMIKAVGRGVIDTRNAFCKIMDTTINYGNPYGIDPQKVFVGGVSGGAICFLFNQFLDSLDWMPQKYKDWTLEIEPNAQELLNNKFCRGKILGLMNISGAVLDTSWIKPGRNYPPVLSQHGTADPIIPYTYGKPLAIFTLPNLMGSGLIDKRMKHLGYRSEIQVWKNASHAPFFGGINLEALLSPNPLAVTFNPVILDSTKRHYTHFFYSLLNLDCNNPISAIKQNIVNSNVTVFPNPSNGNFNIQLPTEAKHKNWAIEIYDLTGKKHYQKDNIQNMDNVSVSQTFTPGIYFAKLYYIEDNIWQVYTGSIIIH